jgi:hypothetical protein
MLNGRQNSAKQQGRTLSILQITPATLIILSLVVPNKVAFLGDIFVTVVTLLCIKKALAFL